MEACPLSSLRRAWDGALFVLLCFAPCLDALGAFVARLHQKIKVLSNILIVDVEV
jgi:hypothetical protein